jgi:predicted transcriptional regulator
MVKITDETIQQITDMYVSGVSVKIITQRLHVSKTTVHQYVSGKRKKESDKKLNGKAQLPKVVTHRMIIRPFNPETHMRVQIGKGLWKEVKR